VLGVEDERDVHHFRVKLAGLAVVEHVQEVGADGVVVLVGIDAYAVVAVAVPVADDGRQGCEHAVDVLVLFFEALLGLQVAEHGAAGAHDVHGVSGGRDAFEDFLEGLRKLTLL